MNVLTQRILPLLFVGLLLAPSAVTAENNEIAIVIEIGREDSQVMDHLDVLCNRIGPRLTSSDSLQVACDWARDRFAEMGLESRLEQWGEFPVGFNRGPASGRMITPEVKSLEFGTNAWTAGTKGRMLAKAMMAPEKEEEWVAAMEKMADTWVLIKRPPRRGASSEQREKFNQALERIREAGPAGIIYSTRDNLITTGGRYRIEWENLPTVPEINLRVDQWEDIAGRLAAGEEVELEFDIRNHFRQGPIPQYNVIADIPGTEFPDQYVIVGGHLDSWDGATGANDNGAGVATTMEAARLLMEAGVKPRRTIRFMLWTGEEQGLLGSRAYVEANPKVVDNTSAVLVHDGGTNYVAGIRCTEDMVETMEKVFAPIMDLDERTPFEIETVDGLRGGGSDHASFIRKGCPGFFWKQAGRSVYRQVWHTQFDTYDSVVPEYQQHSSIVIATGALGLANLDELLSRKSFENSDDSD